MNAEQAQEQIRASFQAHGFRQVDMSFIDLLMNRLGVTNWGDATWSVDPDLTGDRLTQVMAHELGHVVLGHGTIGGIRDTTKSPQQEEHEADAWAIDQLSKQGLPVDFIQHHERQDVGKVYSNQVMDQAVANQIAASRGLFNEWRAWSWVCRALEAFGRPYVPTVLTQREIRSALERPATALPLPTLAVAEDVEDANFVVHDVTDEGWLDGGGLQELAESQATESSFLWDAKDHPGHEDHARGDVWSAEGGWTHPGSPCAREFLAHVEVIHKDQYGDDLKAWDANHRRTIPDPFPHGPASPVPADPQPRQAHRTPVAPSGYRWESEVDALTGWPFYRLRRIGYVNLA